MAAAFPVIATPDARTAARDAGLRHVTDASPGMRRRRAGAGFTYVDARGRAVRDPDTLARIRALAIPPAWTDVWICLDEDGHIQATGRDARGRKQYRYHPRWRAVRDEAKYERTLAFGAALPRIRSRVARDLALPGLPREKVLALVVRLLEMTLMRVGNEEYARANGSFGLTTLRARHADVDGGSVRLRFRGKSGKIHEATVDDPKLARLVRRCRDLPGQELFQYVDEDGHAVPVTSSDVNAYLRETTGYDFTAKDFRTWAGTVQCALALRAHVDAPTRRRLRAAITRVAERLANTPAVSRKCYIHPAVVDAYLDGRLPAVKTRREAERAVLTLLKARGRGSRPAPERSYPGAASAGLRPVRRRG